MREKCLGGFKMILTYLITYIKNSVLKNHSEKKNLKSKYKIFHNIKIN